MRRTKLICLNQFAALPLRLNILIPISFSIFTASCSVTENLSNDIQIKDLKKNEISKDYHKILIVASGSSVTRIFEENLFTSLHESFDTTSMETKFIYLGKDAAEINSSFSKIRSSKLFDALPVIFPESSFKISELNDVFVGVQTRSIKLDQALHLSMFDKSDNENSIWEASMVMNINLTRSHIYSVLSKSIINHLKANYLVQ